MNIHVNLENGMLSLAIKAMMANFSSRMSTLNDSELNLWK